MTCLRRPPHLDIVYDAEDGSAAFHIAFDRETEISGYMVLHVWLEADGSDDMDIAVSVLKRPGFLARARQILPGPPDENRSQAMLRVSCRELDEQRSTPSDPVLAMWREMRLKAGEIVPVTIALSPMAMLFRKNEEMTVTVSGGFCAVARQDLSTHSAARPHRSRIELNRGPRVLWALLRRHRGDGWLVSLRFGQGRGRGRLADDRDQALFNVGEDLPPMPGRSGP